MTDANIRQRVQVSHRKLTVALRQFAEDHDRYQLQERIVDAINILEDVVAMAAEDALAVR